MRVALVTGGGGGIGRRNAVGLAADGFAVAVNDIDGDAAEAVAAEITAAGGTALAAPASVTDFDASRAMVERVAAELGPVEVLVSGVSLAGRGKSLLFTELEEVEELLRMNVLATLVLCQAVIPGMRERRDGAIVVISSIAAQAMAPKGGSYAIAKGGLETIAYTLAKEEAKYGIRVNVVAPGETDTPLGRLVRGRIIKATTGRDPVDDDFREGMVPPTGVADVVRYLASPAAQYVTGQRLNVANAPTQVLTPHI